MSHHSYDPMNDKRGDMLRGLFAKQRLAEAAAKFPNGKLVSHDEGVLAFGVGVEKGKVVIHFAEPTAWIGMTGDQAMQLAQLLISHARNVGLTKPATIEL